MFPCIFSRIFTFPGWFMAVEPGSLILHLTQITNDIHYFALFEGLKDRRFGSSHDTCITEKTDAGRVQEIN